MRACLLLIATAACGRIDFAPRLPDAGPPDRNDGNHSGTRLKIVWNQFEDGARQHIGVFDTQRGERCALQFWSDNNTYCTPSSSIPALYADASCEQALGVTVACENPAYFEVPDRCGFSIGHLYPNAGVSTTTMYWQAFTPTQCSGPFFAAGNTIYDVGPEVSTSALAMVVTPPPQTAGRIGTSYFTAPDGFLLEDTLYDSQLGATCYGQLEGSGYVCDPATGGTTFAVDAQCTQHVAIAPESCPVYGFQEAPGPGCVMHHYTVTDTSIAPPGFQWDEQSSTCITTGAPSTTSYYQAGPDVVPAQVARIYDTEPGLRLQHIHYTGDAGRFADVAFYDTQLGVECTAQNTVDGMTRCVPATAVVGHNSFADAACTMPIGLVTGPIPVACNVPPPDPVYAIDLNQPDGCTTLMDVYAVGALIPGPVYSLVGTCMEYVPLGGSAVYQLGPHVDLSTFASATVVTDP